MFLRWISLRLALALSALLVAGTLLHIAAAHAGPSGHEDDLPEGCEVEVENVTHCSWSFELGPDEYFRENLSWVGTAIMDLRITPEGPDLYVWNVQDMEANEAVQWENGQTGETSGVFYLELEPDGYYTFNLWRTLNFGPPNSFEVKLTFHHKEGTERPEEPAGGPDDPQLVGAMGDVSGPRHMDIKAGWFDQPYLDDGLIEVGLVVPYLHEAGVDEEEVLAWSLEWTLLGQEYEVIWSHFNESNPLSVAGQGLVSFDEWQAVLFEDEEVSTHLFPTIDTMNGTLSARVPLTTIGDPQDGVRFKNLSAYSKSSSLFTRVTFPGTPLSAENPSSETTDEATEILRLFAVGGPEVWNDLRGVEDDEEAEEPEAQDQEEAATTVSWYANPLAVEHLPDTFQILGGVLGALAFLWGLVFVRRRRKLLSHLLEEIEDVVKTHRNDPQAALAALDRLETRFDTMLEAGKLQEHQHSTLLTKIERVGYRLVRQAEGQTAEPSKQNELPLE